MPDINNSCLNDAELTEAFVVTFVTSSEEVIVALDKKRLEIDNKLQDAIAQHDKNKELLCDSALKLVRSANREKVSRLPALNREQGWTYEWRIDTEGLKLQTKYIELPVSMGQLVFEQLVFERIIVPSRFLSVSEYAKLHEVLPVTVRQWIRRGKLAGIKKVMGEWMISELSLPDTNRNYSSHVYWWNDYLESLPTEFSYLNDYKEIMISQDEDDKTIFIISLRKDAESDLWVHDKYRTIEEQYKYWEKKYEEINASSPSKINLYDLELRLSKNEKEKLEYYLLGNSSVRSTSELWFVI